MGSSVYHSANMLIYTELKYADLYGAIALRGKLRIRISFCG